MPSFSVCDCVCVRDCVCVCVYLLCLHRFKQHSYGFIQCCERQARLFFHFSQFSGNIEHLKIGDPVEFEMTYDRRTGKPIASQVSKIAPEVKQQYKFYKFQVFSSLFKLIQNANQSLFKTSKF